MVSRVLLATGDLTLGEFACAPDDRLWHEVNDIGGRAHVVIPRTHVLIAQDGAPPVLATPNHVVFYKPHQLYRRGLRDDRGDRSLWLEIADDLPDDRATDLIFSEPSTPDGGRTWVYSGRTGRLIYRLPGDLGDDQGYAIADAGDTNHDGVHDIISGAPSQTGGGPGRAYLYSGRSGRLLHAFTGDAPGDQFGSAVSTAGDQNHDGYGDVLVGAQGANAAYVLSGRTYQRLRRIDGPPGAGLGSGTDLLGRHRLIVGALTEDGTGGVHVFSRAGEQFSLAPPPGARRFGQFFVAGVGRVDGDRVPDLYAGDYAAQNGNGFAGVYAGRDGSLIHGWPGGTLDGTGPGREAGDVDRDGRVDLAVGSYTASDGAPAAGRVDVRSGRTGAVLRTITSTTENENLGFDVVGIGDVNCDGRSDLLVSAAEGDTVYVIAG